MTMWFPESDPRFAVYRFTGKASERPAADRVPPGAIFEASDGSIHYRGDQPMWRPLGGVDPQPLPWAARASTDPATTYYVSTLAGNDSTGDGSEGSPYATIDKALQVANTTDCTVLVRAPASAPLVDYTPVTLVSNVVIDAWDEGETWHHHGMAASTSGWSSSGGGVYQRTTSRTTVSVFVPSIIETIGDRTFWKPLIQNTATPTTPDQGQFGYAANVLYVRLPGDANPNSHTIMHPTTVTNVASIAKTSTGTLKIRNARFVAGNLEHVTVSAGSLVLESVEGLYAGTNGGFQATGTAKMRCVNVRSWRCLNDGFNIKNSAAVTLIDCDGSYNEDEGVSPHETSTVTISGGLFRFNGCGGATSVDSAVMHITRSPIFEGNHRNGVLPNEGAITYYGGLTSGRLSSARCVRNAGAGIMIHAGATVLRSDVDIESSTNGAADNYAYT